MTGYLLGKGDPHASADDEAYRQACAPTATACFQLWTETEAACGHCGKAWESGGCGRTLADLESVTLRARPVPLSIAAE